MLRGGVEPDAIYRGGVALDRVYRGSTLVWEPPTTETAPLTYQFVTNARTTAGGVAAYAAAQLELNEYDVNGRRPELTDFPAPGVLVLESEGKRVLVPYTNVARYPNPPFLYFTGASINGGSVITGMNAEFTKDESLITVEVGAYYSYIRDQNVAWGPPAGKFSFQISNFRIPYNYTDGLGQTLALPTKGQWFAIYHLDGTLAETRLIDDYVGDRGNGVGEMRFKTAWTIVPSESDDTAYFVTVTDKKPLGPLPAFVRAADYLWEIPDSGNGALSARDGAGIFTDVGRELVIGDIATDGTGRAAFSSALDDGATEVYVIQGDKVAAATLSGAYVNNYRRLHLRVSDDWALGSDDPDTFTVGDPVTVGLFNPVFTAYVIAALDLGAVFVQNGNLDLYSNTNLTGGSDPGVSVDGVAAWAGDWSFTLGASVPADCTIVGLVRCNASTGYSVPVLWDGTDITSRVGLFTRSLSNTKGGLWVYNTSTVVDAYSPRDETAWVAVGARGEDGVGGYGTLWVDPSSSWQSIGTSRNLYTGTKNILSMSAAEAADDNSYVCGLAVFPTQLSDTEIQDLLALLPSAF